MDRHKAAVAKIAATVRSFYAAREPYRIFHGSTNSTRPRPSASQTKTVDISALRNVLSVDTARRVAVVEPNVPMDRLVEATLPHGLVPPVVMEFPGITAGGGFAGTAGESSSFRHGFFDDTVRRVEMVLADGEVVEATRGGSGGPVPGRGRRGGHAGHDHAARGAADGGAPDHGVVVTGQLTDEAPPAGQKVQTFSGPWDPWFYLHAKERTAPERGDEGAAPVDHVPLAEYLFRYDRGGFWVGAAAFEYFGFVPFNRFSRWFLDDFLHTRMMYRALHGSGESARFVVQDVAMPFETTERFVDYTSSELGIWPLWLCPLKRRRPPTFHPFTTLPEGVRKEPGDDGDGGDAGDADMMLNVGVWGWGPSDPAEFVRKNRELENKVRELGGMKWLYAHTYYPEDEFWSLYGGREWYDELRDKYNAKTLPTVWDKVHVDPDVARAKKRHWLKRLPPLGGFYGIYKSIQSKDYLLHRHAKWKWKGE
ncbi:uncharacterized protein P884DRAFT_249503 [Thermothelomyces heterothallicus CBS 202.75]|uniref:uncharacterized protein n=1 Tax=Thermothelomyces heterothallicus CBS 202.75 TaxID=1149848 RepID=UPI0037426E9A